MICGPCCSGGDITRAIRLGHVGYAGHQEKAWAMAASFHAECRGSTWCDCQHRPMVLAEPARA